VQFAQLLAQIKTIRTDQVSKKEVMHLLSDPGHSHKTADHREKIL